MQETTLSHNCELSNVVVKLTSTHVQRKGLKVCANMMTELALGHFH